MKKSGMTGRAAARYGIGGLLLAVFLLCVCMTAAGAEGDYTIDSMGVLTKYSGSGTDVRIPDGVTKIANTVFSGKQKITSVVIPEGVTEIGDYAFQNCSGLRDLVLPQSLTRIGNQT